MRGMTNMQNAVEVKPEEQKQTKSEGQSVIQYICDLYNSHR